MLLLQGAVTIKDIFFSKEVKLFLHSYVTEASINADFQRWLINCNRYE